MTHDDTLPGGPGFASARQVAERAGVSRSAVSRAFTPGASIAAETRAKVMRAAEELGYQVNDLARGLLANRSRLVGLVVTGPEVGFRAHLVAALTAATIARGSVPVVINTGRSEAEMEAAHRTLFGHRAEAVIVLSGSPPSSFVEQAQRNGQPLVVIGRSDPGCDHVRTDNEGAARRAARLFVGRGLRHLAVAGSASGTPALVERERAFVEEAALLGTEIVVAHGSDADYAGGQDAARQLFSRAAPPEAVFCVNDLTAFGVMDVARLSYGRQIPRDLAVIGFDDIPEAAWDSYRLTTFRQDPAATAARAMALIDRRQSTPDAPPAIETIAPPLVVRDSMEPLEDDKSTP